MRLTRKLLVGLFFTAVSAWVLVGILEATERLPVDDQVKLCIRGRDLLLQRRYEEAESFLKKIVADWPEEILGPFGLMTLYQIRNLENFDFRFDAAYLPWEDQGRKKALSVVRKPEASAWDLLLAGGTLGIAGFYRAHNGRWLAALHDGSTGVHMMEKSLRDPGLVDGLLGVGLYDYWRSYFTRKFRWLPFFPDRSQEGREKLLRAQREGRFVPVLATIAIAYLDFQEKRYEKVLETAGSLLKVYPRNTILRMLRGETLMEMKRYPEAVAVFQEILAIDPSLTKSLFFIGVSYAREGKDKEKARQALEKFLQVEPKAPPQWRRPALEHLKKLESPEFKPSRP